MLLALVGFLVTADAAGADTASELAAARQKVTDAQNAANAAAAELTSAEVRSEELATRITQLENEMHVAQGRVAALQVLVKQRALVAYTRGGQTDLDSLVSSEDALEATRRARLLDGASQRDSRDARRLASLRADLLEQQRAVQAQHAAQQHITSQLETKSASVQSALADAGKARDELIVRLEREQAAAAAAAAAAELARLKAEQAARRPIVNANGAAIAGSAGQIIANPGGGSFQCPLVGSAYTNSFGPRGGGFHYGIDMFAAAGVPLAAVKAGTVSYVPNGGAGGNEVYLAANDGNVYYYAHLSAFVGGPRAVAQGEVVGLVGSTGRSTGPHLHFEIRLGGANGQKINPFPTLQSAGC